MSALAGERARVRPAAVARPATLFIAFGAGTFLLHVIFAGGYGYQRDELYFLACAHHLAWGYVDQPPLIAVVAAISTALFGDSLHAIRLLPALASAATVVLSGLLARHFGAGRYGQAIAMSAVLVSPIFLYAGTIMTMNAFEPLIWTLAAWCAVRILDAGGSRAIDWAGFALCVAAGILNKYTMGFFAVALFAAALLLPQRNLLWSRRAVVAYAAIFALIAPNLLWQQVNGWPQIEVLRGALTAKNPALSPAAFLVQQILMVNPATFPIWAAGLWFLWRSERYRAFALAYALLFTAYLAVHGKVYYIASFYPLLFAAGSGPVERFLRGGLPRVTYAAALALVGLVIAPQVLPILPLPAFLAYQRVVDLRHIREERREPGTIPQQFADMLGWRELTATVAGVYAAVPPSERGDTAILTRDYGMAGAIDRFGRDYGLPGAISGHNNYYLWGPRGYSGARVIAVGIPEALLRSEFRSVVPTAVFHDGWLLPQDNDIPIVVCAEPVEPLAAFWPKLRDYR